MLFGLFTWLYENLQFIVNLVKIETVMESKND